MVTMTRFHLAFIFVVASLAAQQQVGALDSAPQIEEGYCNSLGITGGHKVSIKDIPFIASIGDGRTICGGSIIHERFILTAASCFTGDTGPNVTVLIGTDTLSENGVFFDIEQVLCHENFDNYTLDNDICLLKLPSALPFAWLVQVALPDKDFSLDISTWVNVTGWGAIKNRNDPMEDKLRQVEIPILSDQCCDDYYEGFNDKLICAGLRGHDFCEGDIGGPLTYNGIQIGVVSGGGECGKHPGAYTRVTSYVDWIESTIINHL